MPIWPSTIRLPLPVVVGTCDYAEPEALLRPMDDLLVSSGAESAFMESWVFDGIQGIRQGIKSAPKPLNDCRRASLHRQCSTALRCMVARNLTMSVIAHCQSNLAEFV